MSQELYVVVTDVIVRLSIPGIGQEKILEVRED
jgi:hypothetical protein